MDRQNRGGLVTGIILILFGALFLLFNVADRAFEALDIGFRMWRLWPMVVVLIGLAFYSPIFIWWKERQNVIGFAMPGTIFLVNGLLLLYQIVSGDWDSWAYAWAFEPIAVGLGLLMMYVLGNREQGVLIAAGIVGGIGLLFLIIFGSMFGGLLVSIIGPLLLVGAGLVLLLSGFVKR